MAQTTNPEYTPLSKRRLRAGEMACQQQKRRLRKLKFKIMGKG